MRALMVPAATDQPCTVIEWQRDGELLALLYGAIGCDTVDTITVYLDGAQLYLWVDDNGLYAHQPALNARAHRLLSRLGGALVSPIVGAVVITEGADPDGNTQGLRESLLLDLQVAMAPATTTPTGD